MNLVDEELTFARITSHIDLPTTTVNDSAVHLFGLPNCARCDFGAEEILEVSGQDTKRQVVNLAETIDHKGQPTVRRRGDWFRVKDRGHMDAHGYFFHAGRSDDVIISAGWTMSALEIEQALLAHPDVREAAVIGVPDELRGQVPKACIVAPGKGPAFAAELQEFVKSRLSQHEYPRAIEIVGDLPKTPAGKIDRKTLRDRKGA